MKQSKILSDVSSLPWFHPVHAKALELIVKALEIAVDEAIPEFWDVQGDALYRAVLACPEGWDDAVMRRWHGAVELRPPAVRTLVSPFSGPAGTAASAFEEDDLDDAIRPKRRPGDGKTGRSPGGA